MNPLALQLLALGATLAIELPIAALLARRGERAAHLATVLATVLCANLASHSAASLVWATTATSWITLELAVVLFEAAALRFVAQLSWPHAAVLALAMNVTSAVLGMLFF